MFSVPGYWVCHEDFKYIYPVSAFGVVSGTCFPFGDL